MKKNCNIDKCGHFFDTLFWWIMYSLPLVLTLLLNMNESVSAPLKMYDILNEIFGYPVYNGVVYETLRSLFGNNNTAIIKMFSDDVIYMFSWFVNMHILHLAVDAIVFIPRWSHKMIDKFMKEV